MRSISNSFKLYVILLVMSIDINIIIAYYMYISMVMSNHLINVEIDDDMDFR